MAVTETLIGGRYRLSERLGSGAMGEVWRAHDERLDRTVAVKRLFAVASPDGTARALREARNAARLQHPHAVTVHDVVEHDGHPCLVMEYVPADSLATVVREHGPLTPERAARVGEQLASALAAAHDAGVVHRDVKPDNVLLTDDEGARITDFGISRIAGDGSPTSPGFVVGTPAFLAPEVAAGGDATFASDVFSLGATLYAAVEGAPPFGYGDNTILLLRAVAEGQVPPAAHAGPLAPVLAWLLRRDPAQRPTMTQAAEALSALADGRSVVPPQATLLLPARPAVRHRTVVAALTAAGLVAVGLVTGVLIGAHGSAPVAAAHQPVGHKQAPPTVANAGCVADYSLVNSWQGGYQAQVTVTNDGGTALDGWSVSFDVPDGETITQVWSGQLSQQGASATIANASYNATMSADASTTFGFLGAIADGTPVTPQVRCVGR
jgi:hypothetical protein